MLTGETGCYGNGTSGRGGTPGYQGERKVLIKAITSRPERQAWAAVRGRAALANPAVCPTD